MPLSRSGLRRRAREVVQVGYRLGVDLGTTFTAAAVARDGRLDICWLEDRSAELPSLLLLREDGTFAVGEAADRWGTADPSRLARHFKRRMGDPTPFLLGGSPWSAHALTAVLLRDVVRRVTAREGSRPDEVVVTHPANWGPYKRELLVHATELADVPHPVLCPEPSAAVLRYAAARGLPTGSVVAVYDLGGGTFDAAVLVCSGTGAEILGTPVGIEQLGGVDFDDAVLQHVLSSVGRAELAALPDDADTAVAVERLRRDCVAAKEALSSEDETRVQVLLPGVQTSVRLTRGELEDLVRPPLQETLVSLHRALDSARVDVDDLTTVLLTGGSSRIPLVAELLSSEFGRPLSVDAHPKHVIALGAASYGPTATDTAAAPARRLRRRTPRADPGARVESGATGGHPTAAAPERAPAHEPGPTPRGASPATVLELTERRRPPSGTPARTKLLVTVVLAVGLAVLSAIAWRVLDDAGEDDVVASGSAGAPADVVVRLEGPDRYTTSAEVALGLFDRARTAVLAGGEGYADGLVAQALAGTVDGGAPFLLTSRSHLPAATLAALQRLAVRDVVIVGDPTAVSVSVQESVEQAGIRVSRLEGQTRSDTALAVARALDSSTVLIVDGFDEGLVAVGPVAHARGWPVVTWSPQGLDEATMSFLASSRPRAVLVPTGTQAAQVRAQLTAAGVRVDLLGAPGEDPVQAVPQYAVASLGWPTSRLTLTASGPADALSAAQLAAQARAPLLLTGQPGSLSNSARSVLESWPGTVSEFQVVGDETTVTPQVLEVAWELVGPPR